MSFTLQNCLLSFVLLNFATTINAVPVTVVDVLNSTSTNETIPDPVNINGSVAVLDTTLPPVELTTTVDMANLRNARSEEEPVKLSSESPNSPDQVKNKSSAIQFPKDDVIEISSDVTNTSASSSTPVEPVIKLAITDSSSSSVEFFNSVRKSIESRPRDGKATRSQVTMMPIGTPQVMYNTPDGFEMIDLSDALYRERVIFIGDEINEEFSNQILATMLYLDSLDSSKKLFMFISGPGGDLTPTMAIYDTMQSLNSSVATHCVGFAYNLAAFLLAAGEKGNRCSMPLSRIAFESPAGAARGQADDIRNEADELLRIRDYLFKELSEKTGQPIEKVHKDFSRVKRFTAPEALEYGLIDRILYPNRLDTDAPRRDAPPRDANAGLG